MQGYADSGDQQQFYSALKAAHGQKRAAQCPVRSRDGDSLLTEREDILSCWAEHYRELLNTDNLVDPSLLKELSTLPTIQDLDIQTTREEISKALDSLKHNKARQHSRRVAEVWRCCCFRVSVQHHFLHLAE